MLIVQAMTPIHVNAGGSVFVYGSGFDSQCWVRIGSQYMPVLDYDDDCLEFSAPFEIARYTVTIGRGAVVAGEFYLSVVPLRESSTWNVGDRTVEDFRDALIGMMPRGFAWYLGRGGNWWKLFSAFGNVVLTVYNLFKSLVLNMSPAKTTAYSDWERELNLPIKGLEPSSDDVRLDEIYRVARKRAGDTVPYYRSLAALFGRDVKIYEYFKNPEKFEGVDFGSDDPNFYWMVEQTSSDDDWHICDCNDNCNDYLGWWWNPVLEAYFELLKPAHTKVLYTYALPEVVRFITEDGNYFVMTEDGDYVVTENGAL